MLSKNLQTNQTPNISCESIGSLVRRVNCATASVACLPNLVDDLKIMVDLDQIAFEDHKDARLFNTRIHSIKYQINDVYLWIMMVKELLIDIGINPGDFDNSDDYFFNGEDFPENVKAGSYGKAVEDTED